MRKNFTPRAQARKDTTKHPEVIHTKSAKIFRAGFKLTPEQAKNIFGFLSIPRLRSLDEIHILYFIEKPEKGGRKR